MGAKAVFIDGTHIKASANKKRYENVEVDIPRKKLPDSLVVSLAFSTMCSKKRPMLCMKRFSFSARLGPY